MAFAPGGFEQSCITCQDPANGEVRKAWGCDERTVDPVFAIDCPFCERQVATCAECGGTGTINYHRCPNAIVGRAELDVCSGAVLLEHGVLPSTGGWADQSAKFIDAVTIVLKEKSHYDSQRMKNAARG